MHPPVRAAVFGSRVYSSLTPFLSANSASSPAVQQQCKYRVQSPKSQQQQRRAASAVSICKSFPVPARPSAPTTTNTARTTLCKAARPPTSALISAFPIRTASTQATTSTANPTSSRTATSSSSSPQNVQLDWNTFFQLRKSRRRYSLISSILGAVGSMGIGLPILAANNIDALGAQVMGFDPFIVFGLATAALAAVGWLVGPVLGNGLWRVVHRKYSSGVAAKEKEFFHRIKRYRVDPSANSVANPVPDFYGEKIGSVQGYRQWLKDQRAFNRKKRRSII
ncbi:hypothetical protein AJ80_09737 [Polytolypa hystricis UAMH7299]|uniref:Presequence translocated-associated motor subunit PAM17 n=1 Tax=Polytolypa hystricis (strain UAMH7299) TaxID=1447883 RepID=A0A2B7WKT2_POLH7|nr:hypothetical protein AJ80_09737 [Polytolypa hystricis UAMH7299]